MWVDTEARMAEFLDKITIELEECPLLAVDLEYYSAYEGPGIDIVKYLSGGALAIMQISTLHSDYIIDIILMRDLIWKQRGQKSLRGLF